MEDTRLERVEEKIDKILEHTADINITLAKQEEQLTYHIKRTDLLEAQLEPIKSHVAAVEAVLVFCAKAIGLLIPLSGALYYALKIMGKLN